MFLSSNLLLENQIELIAVDLSCMALLPDT